MKTPNKSASVLAAFLALSLAASGSAWAGSDRYSHPHKTYKHETHRYGHHDRHGYKQRHYRDHGRYQRNRHDDDDEKLLIGLIIGGVIGYAISQSQPAAAPPVEYYAPEPAPTGGYNNGYYRY
jgi:hypothetical protein